MEDEIRPILQKNLKIGDYIKLNWIFTTALEKILLIIFIGLGVWKIIDFFI